MQSSIPSYLDLILNQMGMRRNEPSSSSTANALLALALASELIQNVPRVGHPSSRLLYGLTSGISLSILALVHNLLFDLFQLEQLFYRMLVP